MPGAPPGAGGYPPPPNNPYAPPGGFAPPPPGYPPGYTPMPSGAGVVAWEDRSRPFFSRWWNTTKDVCFNARPFFTGVAESDDPWPSITYSVATGGMSGFVYGLFVGLIYLGMGSMMAAMAGSMPGGKGGAGSPAAFIGIMSAVGMGAALIYPILFMIGGFIGPWVNGGILHAGLALLGGTTKSYQHTVRVVAYAHGAQAWMIIPGVGGLVGLVFQIIALITGLDATHKCGSGKAAGAVFLPLILFICCCCGFYFLVFSMAAAAGPGHR